MATTPSPRGLTAASSLLLLTLTATSSAQVGQVPAYDPTLQPVIVAQAGQIIPGSTVGDLATVQEIDVDSTGAVIARGVTDQGAGLLLVNWQAFGVDTEHDLDGDEVLISIGPSLSGSASGHIAYRAVVNPVKDPAIVFDGQVVLQRGELMSTPGIPGNATLSGVRFVTMNDALTIVAFIEFEVGLAAGVALVKFDVDLSGQILNREVIVRPGQSFGGKPISKIGDGKSRSVALTEAGQVGYLIQTISTLDSHFRLDNQTVVSDGDPSPLPGGEGIDLVVGGGFADSELDVTTAGDWAVRTRVLKSGAPELLLHGDALVAAEGQVLPGSVDPVNALGAPDLGTNGNVLYSATYVPTTPSTAVDALYLGDRPLVGPGTVIGSKTVHSVAYPPAPAPATQGAVPYAMDAAGETVYVSVVFTDGDWALLRYDIGPWVSEGHGLAGSGSAPPRLAASGPLVPGTNVQLALLDGQPNGSAALVVGFSKLNMPFKAGVLCPTVDELLLGLPLDGTGTWQLSATWPLGTPSGIPTWWQAWTLDPGGPDGFAATNCLRGTSG